MAGEVRATCQRRILLVLRKTGLQTGILDYVCNLCQRLQAGLDILLEESLSNQLEDFFKKLRQAGVHHQVLPSPEPWEEMAVSHANTTVGIVFVVVSVRSEFWHKLNCPWVEVIDPDKVTRA
jgi:hypothetical protein